MRNKRFTLKSFLISLVVLAATPVMMNAQSASEIEAAKAYARSKGYSEQEINAVVNRQIVGGTSETKKVVQTGTSVTVNRNADQSQAVRGGQAAAGMYSVTGEASDARGNAVNKSSQPFGHAIFKQANLNFIPSYNIPTPDNYKLSAGDEIIIDLWGAVVTNISSQVSPEGSINIPDLGPVYIYGQTVKEAEKNLRNYMSKIYSGLTGDEPDTFLRLSLGKIKSVSINVIGDVETPGSYTLPSLSSIASALYLAGGPNGLGTVRDIKLYRNNKLKSTFDVYEYVLNGQIGDNVMLEDNDLVIVSPSKTIVTVNGNVKRPMKYELKEGETIEDILRYCSGFSTSAYKGAVQVDRYRYDGSDANKPVAITFNVEEKDFGSFKLVDGDVITVRDNNNRFANKASIEGAVWHPGSYPISDELSTLKQLLVKAGGLRENAYMDRGYILRLDENREEVQVAFNVNQVILGSENVDLMPDDVVRIFTRDELRPNETVQILGEVNSPKTVEYRIGMTLGDLILMAGGITNAATLEKVEIARRIVAGDEPESVADLSDTIAVILNYNLLENPNDANVELKPFDMVFVRRSVLYKPQEGISIQGEVNYPGTYVVEKNVVRLSDIVKKADGFNKDAYVEGAKLIRVLTAEELSRVRMAMKIAGKELEDDVAVVEYWEISDRYTIAINLKDAIENPGSYADVVLRTGDIISVPKMDNTVKIRGAVLYSNAIAYSPNMSFKNYISNAGGYLDGALKRKVYMVHMNGTVAVKGSKDFKVYPGTEIVVPYRVEKDRNNNVVSTILSIATTSASIATMVATIASLSK